MKVTVSIELDLSDNPSLNIENIDGLNGALQNLGSFFNDFHTAKLMKLTRAMANQNLDQVTKDALLKLHNEDIGVSEQFFDNYKVEGTTDDGHKFVFTHQEPGYKEKMIIDGVEQ